MASLTEPRPGFYVYRGARIEALAGALAKNLFASPPKDVISPVDISVGSKGMERWLRHRLAVELGISANFKFPFPGQAISAVYGADPKAHAAWTPEALAWQVLEVLPELLDTEMFRPIARWLEREADDARPVVGAPIGRDRWSLARELADVLDRAALFRPEWTQSWDAGAAISGPTPPPPWQGELWRAVRRRIAHEHPTQLILSGSVLPGEPLHVFGVSSMPPAWVSALGRAGAVRAVHLYQVTPSNEYWGDVKTPAELRRKSNPIAAEGHRVSQNPILTSLGKLSRDVVDSLLEMNIEDVDVAGAFDTPEADGVLALLQTDVLGARSLTDIRADATDHPLDFGDDSIQFHACHGPTRQVEVLRDVLLDLFDRHPHLEPRHVVVMTPDIGLYAPLLRATLSEGYTRRSNLAWGPAGGPAIPTHIADLGLQELNPLADVLVRALGLVDGRLTATALSDFAALGPVRHRFGFDEAALVRIRGWLAGAGARLGADAAERERLGLPVQHAFTLAFALDRLVLGVTMPDNDGVAFEGVAPFDEMEGSPVRTLGPFIELCARIERWRAALRRPRRVSEWASVLLDLVDALGEVSAKAGFLRSELCEGLTAWAAEANGVTLPVAVDAIAPILTKRFERGRSGDRPATGAVTVCALTPMRSVPFRVVCLIGMDDGVFPRSASPRGFDAAASHPRAGDRDPREEDRNLLLEAILAAREHLVVCYTGQDARTGKPVAPAVPVGDLLDAIDDTVCAPTGSNELGLVLPRHVLTRNHAVQPFSAAGFESPTTSSIRTAHRRFDARMHAAATALATPRAVVPPFLTFDMEFPEATPVTTVSVDELVAWLRKPLQTLVQRRLGLHLGDYSIALTDREPLVSSALDQWDIGRKAIAAYQSGVRSLEEATAQFAARGLIPPGAPGRLVAGAIWEKVELLASVIDVLGAPQRREIRVNIGAVRVSDAVDVHGSEIVRLTVSRATRPADQIEAYVNLVALLASGHTDISAARIIGVGGEPAQKQQVKFTPPADPMAALKSLVDLWAAARTRPLRLVEKTSHAFAQAFLSKPENLRGAVDAAAKVWKSGPNHVGEDVDSTLSLVFESQAPYESDDGISADFQQLSLDLWEPILNAQGSAQ